MMKWRVGEVTVTTIVELEVTGGSRFILPPATREAVLPIGWLQPDFADELDRLKMSIHALVVETPSRRIVDTCLGNDKENRRIPTWNRLQTSFLADLAAAGYPRETIDTVVCTHLHVDHVGWNTMLTDRGWVHVEYAHWTSPHEREDLDRGQRPGRGTADARAHVDPARRYPDPRHRHDFAGRTAGHVVLEGDAYRLVR
jgi:glyoxylase-like metal-dependent hydrolase (beta-lactamase superfamily II)